jgi:hypothetical protein
MRCSLSFLLLLAAAVITLLPAQVTMDDIRNMPVNSWLAVPNTKIRPLDPCPGHNCVYTGVEGVKGVHSYSGAAFDTKRNRLIVWGGGHNAYYGNEMYVFDVDDMQWTRLTDPSTNINVSGYGGDPYPDGQPASRHTYNGLAYIAHADRFFALGGALAAQAGGCGGGLTWTFDFSQNKWFNMQPSGPQPAPECDDLAVYDPIGKKVWWGEGHIQGGTSRWGLYSYDFDTNTWAHVDADNGYNRQISIVDTKRHLLVIAGQGQVVVYDLGATNVKASRQIWSTTGGSGFINDYYMGFVYDPEADRYVGVDGSGTVYALNPDTKQWSTHTPSGTKPDMGWLAGIYGLWQYVPSVNACIFQTNVDNDVHFYKFTAGPGQTGIAEQGRGPQTKLSIEASPNPFNPAVTISLSTAHVRARQYNAGLQPIVSPLHAAPTLTIYDPHGRIVHTASMTTNAYTWNASDLPSGVYYAVLRAGHYRTARQIVLMK